MKRGLFHVLAVALLLAGAATAAFAQSGATGTGRTKVTTVNVTINVNPSGAQVTIAGERKNSPAVFTLNPGTYSVILQAPGYKAETINLTVDGAKGSAQTFAFALQAMQFRLTVQAPVKDAVVTVNRVAKGTVPYVDTLPMGTYTIVVSARGYADFAQTVQLDRDTVVSAQLAPSTFRLTVQSSVRDAVVTVNRVAKGAVPYVESLPPGNYAVVVSARGFADYNQTVQLDRDTVVSAQLSALTYRLSVQSSVRDAVVTVNRVAKGTVPYVESLPLGTYTVVVSARGYSDYGQTVQLDRDTVVDAQLKATTFRLTVQSSVRDAVVTVNRVAKGPVPYTEALPMGTYAVLVSSRGFDDFTQTVQLDRDTVVSADLRSSMATLVLPAKYLEGDVQFVRLYVDGKLVSPQLAARGVIQVQPGKRLIRLASAPVGLAVEGEMIFAPGEQYELKLLLQFTAVPDDSNRGNDNRGNDNRGNDNRGNDNRGNDNRGNDNNNDNNNDNRS